ncbi:MAG: hypothetical protein HQL49_05675, partial [Gammaproteobacteria bacterium]|nr:hypothetical protein [Gammaproteobacteria bacterium]
MKRETSVMTGLLALLVATFLVGCSGFDSDSDGRAVTLVIATPDATGATSESHREKISYGPVHGKPISQAYPGLSKVALSFNAGGYTAEVINRDYNASAFSVDTALNAFIITDTVVNVKLPRVATLTFTVTAYVSSGGVDVQFFKGSTTLSEGDVAAIESGSQPSVAINVENDVDTTIIKTTLEGSCSDSDADTICDIYEDLFKAANGSSDIDGDGTVNSLDSDSDGDGLLDSAELIATTNGNYPQFAYKNRPISSVTATIKTGIDISSAPIVPHIEDDKGDAHTLVLSSQPTHGSATANGLQIQYIPNSGYEGSDSFTITVTDRAGNTQLATVSVSVGHFFINPQPLAMGYNNALVAKSDGTLWSWGNDGATTWRRGDGSVVAPVVVSGDLPVGDIVSVSTGYYGDSHLALHKDGSLWRWGWDYNTYLSYPTPVLDAGGSLPLGGVLAAFAGYQNSYAVTADGSLWAWGYNGYGALGTGGAITATYYDTPQPVLNAAGTPLTNVKAVAGNYAYAAALLTDNTILTWGQNSSHNLASGEVVTQRLYPQAAKKDSLGTPLTGIKSVAYNYDSAFALAIDGTLWGWGRGELGSGDYLTHSLPVAVVDVNKIPLIGITEMV